MKPLLMLAFAMLLAGSLYAQSGFPFSDSTADNWDEFSASNSPILTWYSGLVERVEISVGGTMPDVNQNVLIAVSEITQTTAITNLTSVSNSVATNIVVYTNTVVTGYDYLTITNLTPRAYTYTVDGVTNSGTAYPFLSNELIRDMDASQDDLYGRFVSTNFWGSGHDYQEWMWKDSPSNCWQPASLFTENRVKVFRDQSIGFVTNVGTNYMGWVSSGSSAWTAPYSGFSGPMTLGSVSVGPCYIASGFPSNGAVFDGVYYWRDSYPYWRRSLNDPENYILGGFWKDGKSPAINPQEDGYHVWQSEDIVEDSGPRLILGMGRPYRVIHLPVAYMYSSDYFDTYLDAATGYRKRGGSWYTYSSGTYGTNAITWGTNASPASVTESNCWNYREGASWYDYVRDPAYVYPPGESWYVVGGGNALTLSTSTNTTNHAAVSVSLGGYIFQPCLTNLDTLQVLPTTSLTVSVTGTGGAVPVPFAKITNMTASGSMCTGDVIALVASTGRTVYTTSAYSWETISKRAIDERILALKPLKWTTTPIYQIGLRKIIWQADSGIHSHTTYEDAYGHAYDSASASMLTNQALNWDGMSGSTYGEGTKGWVYVSGNTNPPAFDAEIYFSRQYGTYMVTNLNTNIAHSIVILFNVWEIPNGGGLDYDLSFKTEWGDDYVRYTAIVVTNIASSRLPGHTFNLRTYSTNFPGSSDGWIDQPDRTNNTGTKTMGFYGPNLQAIVTWETGY